MKVDMSCALLFAAFLISFSFSEIIPVDRRIDWDPGIPGGIPEMTSPVERVTDHGADSTGSEDCAAAFNSAIESLSSGGGVVYVPEGEYILESKITIGSDNIVVRGAGSGKTKIFSDHTDNSFEIITYQRGEWQVPGECIKGSYTVTVEVGSLFTPGGFAQIQQENDPDIMYTSDDWNVSWAENSVGQMFEVESISGDSVTFVNPINITFSQDLNPLIRPQGFVERVGFEKFYIEKLQAGGSTFLLKNSAYCWLKNIESCHTREVHVDINESIGTEVRGCYFHKSFDYGGGGSGYGVNCTRHVTNCLIENNVFDSLRHAMVVQVGSNGNVYGYNYSINNVQGTGETNLNDGWVPPDISIHGHYPFMNLFEGNYVQEIGIADYWGPAGPGNTYFRNSVNDEGIIYYDHSDRQNVVGCVTTLIRDNDGNSGDKLEHGNVIDGSTVWDVSVSDQQLPDSYYLDSKPDFFRDLNWPVYGPDCDHGNLLPAQARYESGEPVTSVLSGDNRIQGTVVNNCRLTGNRLILSWYNTRRCKIDFIVYDAAGKLIKEAKPEMYNKGFNEIGLNADGLSSGLYLINFHNNSGWFRSEKLVIVN